MAYGIKTPDKMPPGRRAFANAEVIRPGKYDDGQDRDGTPPGNQHDGSATRKGYTEGEKYRAGMRDTPSVPNNETVHSKATRNYGRNPTTGAIRGSTGEQPAKIRGDAVPGAMPQVTRGGPAQNHVETVGHLPNTGGAYRKASHPNADRGLHGNADFSGSAPRTRDTPRGSPTGSIRSETGDDSPA